MNVSDASNNAAKGISPPVARRSHKLRWILLVLSAIVVLGAAAAYWMLFVRVYRLEAYQSAMRTIRSDEQLRRDLGEPIKAVNWPWPAARWDPDERDLRWEIEGPKGRANVHIQSTLMQGKWQTRQLEVTQPGERARRLDEADGGDVAAPFVGPAKPAEGKAADSKPAEKKPQEQAPGPQMNFTLPPDAGPPK